MTFLSNLNFGHEFLEKFAIYFSEKRRGSKKEKKKKNKKIHLAQTPPHLPIEKICSAESHGGQRVKGRWELLQNSSMLAGRLPLTKTKWKIYIRKRTDIKFQRLLHCSVRYVLCWLNNHRATFEVNSLFNTIELTNKRPLKGRAAGPLFQCIWLNIVWVYMATGQP